MTKKAEQQYQEKLNASIISQALLSIMRIAKANTHTSDLSNRLAFNAIYFEAKYALEKTGQVVTI